MTTERASIQCDGCRLWFPSLLRVSSTFRLCSWCYRAHQLTIARLAGIEAYVTDYYGDPREN